MKQFRAWSVLMVMVVWPAAAWAQTPAAPSARDIVDARIDLSFVNATGNSRTQTLGVAGDMWVRPDHWAFRNKVAYVRSDANHALNAESLTVLLRVERPAGRAFVFGEYNLLIDRKAGLAARNAATIGLQWKALRDARGHDVLSFFSGAGWARESRVATGATGPRRIDSAVVNAGWSLQRAFGAGAELKDDFRADLALDRTTDWRLTHTISLSAAISARLSLKVVQVLRFAHDPPPSFRQTDTLSSVALVVKF